MTYLRANFRWLAPLALVAAFAMLWFGKPELFHDRVELLERERLSDSGHAALLAYVLEEDDLATVRAHANAGLGEAQLVMGLCYETGHDGCGYDSVEAASLYRSAAANGIARAHERLCTLHLFGRGVEADGAKARQACVAGVDAGDRASAARLADLDLRHIGSQADIDEAAITRLTSLAEAGNVPAMLTLAGANGTWLGGSGNDHDRKMSWIRAAHEAGSIFALDDIVRQAFRDEEDDAAKRAALAPLREARVIAFPQMKSVLGELVSRLDTAEGQVLLREASQSQHPVSQAHFAYTMYEASARGEAIDRDAMLEIARRSAEQGDPFGTRVLMLADDALDEAQEEVLLRRLAYQGLPFDELRYAEHLNRRGTLTPDQKAAVQVFFERNARRGVPDARKDVVALYTDGRHFPVDLVRARALRSEFAAAGDPDARRELAKMMLDGEGGPADYSGAITLLSSATSVEDRMMLARALKKRANSDDNANALAIYEDLGRAGHVPAMEQAALQHSFNGEYGKADEWFWEALQKATPEQRKMLRMSMVVHNLTKSFRTRTSNGSARRASSSYRDRPRSAGSGSCTTGDGWVRCDAAANYCTSSRKGNDVACGGEANYCTSSRDGTDVACGGRANYCSNSRDGSDVACGGQANMCTGSRNGTDVACGGRANYCSSSRDGYRASCGGATSSCQSPRNNRGGRVCGGGGRYFGD